MKNKLNIRDAIYIDDLKHAARMTPLEKLKLAIELSDFCRYLQSKVSAKKGKK